MEAARIISQRLEVESELHAYGLDRGELREVLGAAHWGRANSTEYDPPGYAGWNQYALGTRSLRMVLIEGRKEAQRWTMSNKGGLCRTISPDGTMAIVASSGTQETGNRNKTPKTQNPKGPHSLTGFRINRSQLDLFDSDEADDPWLWFLLVNVRDGEVFGELSLPIDVDDNGRASEWLLRIMLVPDGPEDDMTRRGTHDAGDGPDVEVVRRSG